MLSVVLRVHAKRERVGKAVLINEDAMHPADGNGSGDAKVAQESPVQRRKSEFASAEPRIERMKEPSRKKKGVRIEEATKVSMSR